jgi:hypothetical protein
MEDRTVSNFWLFLDAIAKTLKKHSAVEDLHTEISAMSDEQRTTALNQLTLVCNEAPRLVAMMRKS